MVSKIGGSSPPSTPQTTSADKVETAKPAETTAPSQAATETKTASPSTEQKGQTQKFTEFMFAGITKAAQLMNFKTEQPKLPTDQVLKRNDNQKEPKPEIEELQKQVNQWRTDNGKKPIKEDGFFGSKTEKAVEEFQKANHLKKDGQAGVQTQNRVLMETDANFKQLDKGIQEQTRKQMTDYGKDGAKIQNLREFATSPGLSKLSPAHQQQMLDLQKANPDDPKYTEQLQKLAGDSTFRNLNDATKTDVLNRVKDFGADTGKIENMTKLATSKGFDQLSNDTQKKMLDAQKGHPDDAQLAAGLGKMAGNPGFRNSSDAVKNSVIDTISKNPPATDAKVDSTLNLIGSPGFTKLADSDKKLITDGLAAGKADPKYADNIKTLVDDPKFQALKPQEKTAVLSQVKNYPDHRSVANIDRMLKKDWFAVQDLGDKQRSLKMVAFLSQHDAGDRKVVDNTLEKFLGEKSDFKLEWKQYEAKAGSLTFGEADNKTLWLNKGIMAADNNKMAVNENTKHLVLSTTPHEVNHLMNGDKVDKTYKYFEAEYRAWYVGFKAEHGRVPTNQEAMEQRISWQLNKDSFYGKYANEALKDKKEAAKFYDLMSKMSGQKVDASNFNTVVASDPSTWPGAGDPAPIPGGNVDNH